MRQMNVVLFFAVVVSGFNVNTVFAVDSGSTKIFEEKLGLQIKLEGGAVDFQGKAVIRDYTGEAQLKGLITDLKRLRPWELDELKRQLAGYKRITIKPTRELPPFLERHIYLYDFPHSHAMIQSTVHTLDYSIGQKPLVEVSVNPLDSTEIYIRPIQKQKLVEKFWVEPKAEKLPWIQMFWHHDDWKKDGLRSIDGVERRLFVDRSKFYPELEVRPELRKKMWFRSYTNRGKKPGSDAGLYQQSTVSLKLLGWSLDPQFTSLAENSSTNSSDLAWINQIPGAGSKTNSACAK